MYKYVFEKIKKILVKKIKNKNRDIIFYIYIYTCRHIEYTINK